jgi:hypothetical protein
MAGEPIADQEAGSFACLSLGLRVEYMLDPIHIDGAVSVPIQRCGRWSSYYDV